MSADGIAVKLHLSFELFAAGGFAQLNLRKPVEGGRWQEPTLSRLLSYGLAMKLGRPELFGARFAEFIEGAGPDDDFHFLRERMHAPVKISDRIEWILAPFGKDPLYRFVSEAFSQRQGHANGIAVHDEFGPGFVNARRQ